MNNDIILVLGGTGKTGRRSTWFMQNFSEDPL
jgi:hypothetical protein